MVAGGAKVTNGGFGGDTILDHEGTLTFVATIATTRTQDPSLTCLSGEACVVSEDGDFYARLHLKTATTLAAWQFFGFTTPSNVVSSAAGSNDGFASLDCVTLTSCVTGGFFNTRVDNTATNELLVSSFSTTATDPLTTLIDPDAVADASLQYPVVVGCSPTGSCTLTYDTQSGVYLAATATPPGPVSAVAASAVSATSAKLSWRAPAVTGSGLKGYVVARRLVTATTWNTLALRSTPSVLLTGLTANAHYDVRLEAESTDGSLSAPVTVLVATSKKLMGAGFRFRDSRNANVE
jgi:hypothetical protein